MKTAKVILVLMSFVWISCKDNKKATPKSGNDKFLDPQEVGHELCSCTTKEGAEKEKCIDDFVNEYKNAKFKEEEDIEKMVKEVMECASDDPEVLEVLSGAY